jgi:hypothetical protein
LRQNKRAVHPAPLRVHTFGCPLKKTYTIIIKKEKRKGEKEQTGIRAQGVFRFNWRYKLLF